MPETSPKPFAFVLMPFDAKFSDIYQYGIKAACQDSGAYCERVDEQIFVENILERVYNQIAKADIVISEMTGRNPNVFYETGYAHALNKRVILLTQNAEDIPFDLKHYPHIMYDGKISVLKPELEKRVRWCVENPARPIPKTDLSLEFFVGETSLSTAPELQIICYEQVNKAHEVTGYMSFGLLIKIHNRTNRIADPDHFDLAIACPTFLQVDKARTRSRSIVVIAHTQYIYLPKRHPLFPDGWDSVLLHFNLRSEYMSIHTPVNSRIFTELGAKDHPFSLTFKKATSIVPDA